MTRCRHGSRYPCGECAPKEPEPTMARIVVVLGETYRDDGIAIVLAAVHGSGRFAGERLIDICRTVEGRARVLAWAESLTGMVAP